MKYIMKFIKYYGMFMSLETILYYLFIIANVHLLWHIIGSIGCLMWYFGKLWEITHE